MTFSPVTMMSFDLVTFSGSLTIAALPKITPDMTRYLDGGPKQDLVIDLSETLCIDSSIIRVFINLKKRLDTLGRKVFLVNPAPDVKKVLVETNLDKVFSILDDFQTLENALSDSLHNAISPYTTDFKELKKVGLGCPICDSQHVNGYLIDQRDFTWQWPGPSEFPASMVQSTGQSLDVLSLLPVICQDCFFTSLDLRDFNVLGSDGAVAIPSALDEAQRTALIKAVAKRKKSMELDIVIGDNFFEHPRNFYTSFHTYRIAAETAQLLYTLDKTARKAFLTGWYNFCGVKYAVQDSPERLITDGRTWLTQAVADKSLPAIEQAQAYFALFIFAKRLEKPKDAAGYCRDLTLLAESLPHSGFGTGFHSPQFWYEQCLALCKEDLEISTAYDKLLGRTAEAMTKA